MPPSMLETLSMYKMSVKQWSLKAINRHLFSLCSSSSIFTFFFHYYCVYFFFNFVQLYTWTQVCAAELSSGRLSSRLRASDSSLMAERNTVLYVPSRHTYLSWKTGYSTPPLHTPRQHYTHTHIHMTHTHTALLWPEVTQRGGGDTPCHKETIYTQRHTHIHLAILTHTRSRTHTHWHTERTGALILCDSVMAGAVFIWNHVIYVWVLQQNFAL